MRHGLTRNKLGKTGAHRRAMYRNMVNSLIQHEKMHTTLTKAKQLRQYVEPLITRAGKGDTVANRRLVFAKLRSKEAVRKLFDDIGPHYRERPGGYMRVLRDGFRAGDSAPRAYVELVDRPQTPVGDAGK
ncbi:MAG: 50S ribosomal protein L17 [Candidatus Porifericomitaceae bacterium WSBS_2022_MAG_OTU9]